MLALTRSFIPYAGLALSALSITLTLEVALAVTPRPPELDALREGQRLRAARRSLWLGPLLPLLRFFSGFADLLKLPWLRGRVDVWLRQAGDPLGLVPSEQLAIALILGCAGALVSSALLSVWAAPPFALLLIVAVISETQGAAQRRLEEIERALPSVADLIVLGMEAGLDFVGALRMLVARPQAMDGRMPIGDELQILLNQLHMGRTRRAALEHLRERVPTEAVRTFTTAVITAEEKGMALRDVLRVQAEVLRHRRIQNAQAYVESANLKMMAPILMVVLAIVISLVVPMGLSLSQGLNSGAALGL